MIGLLYSFPPAPLSETTWSTLPQMEMPRGVALQTGTRQNKQQGQEGWNGWRPSSCYRTITLHPLSVSLHHHQHLQRDLVLRQWTREPQIQGSQWLQDWGQLLTVRIWFLTFIVKTHCQNIFKSLEFPHMWVVSFWKALLMLQLSSLATYINNNTEWFSVGVKG